MSTTRKLLREDRGAAAVEFALIVPVLFMLVFGIIDFGRLLYTLNQLTSAAREGARFASVQATFDPAAVENRVRAYVTQSVFGTPVPYNVTVTNPNFAGVASMRVEITNYAFQPLIPFGRRLGLGTIPRPAVAVFRWERAP